MTTLQEVLDDPEVELVVVGLPPKMHAEVARACLMAGKHGERAFCCCSTGRGADGCEGTVLVEKPMTTNSADAQTLIELAKKTERVLYVYQNRRWDGDFLA